jgi:hypothetical protein
MLRHLPLVLIAVVSPAAAAPAFQDTATLDRAVAAFAGKAIGEEGGARTPVDSRLKLAACPMVSMAWRSETHDAVVVTCTGPQWRLFVPIRTPAVVPKGAAPLVITPSEATPLRPVYVIKRDDQRRIAGLFDHPGRDCSGRCGRRRALSGQDRQRARADPGGRDRQWPRYTARLDRMSRHRICRWIE